MYAMLMESLAGYPAGEIMGLKFLEELMRIEGRAVSVVVALEPEVLINYGDSNGF